MLWAASMRPFLFAARMKPAALFLGVLAASAAGATQPLLDPQELEQRQDGISGPEQPVTEKRKSFLEEKLLDRPHEFLSRRVEEYARRLDNFFGDPNRLYDSTGSSLQLRYHRTFFEGGVREGRLDVNANISLPKTEDRLKLIVQRGLEAATQTAAERDIRNATGSNQVASSGAPQDNNFYLGLKALAAEKFRVSLSAEAGVRLGRPPDPYVRLRAFRDFNFSQWQIRASETPLWKNSEGSSAASELDFSRPLDERRQLRFTSKATWRSATSYFDLVQIAALHYAPNPRTAATFELGAFAPSDRNVKLAVYSVTLRLRRQIYRDWLYLEVTPQILYQEATGYSPARSLMLQLETLFGDRYL
jgi:hypothetical protein